MKVVVALALLVAALVAVATASTSFHLARDLREASHAQPASFIVHLRDQLDAASLVKQVRVSSQLTRAALGALVVESALALSLRTQVGTDGCDGMACRSSLFLSSHYASHNTHYVLYATTHSHSP